MKQLLFFTVVLVSLMIACKKDNKESLPIITTTAATGITSSAAQLGGTITNSGGTTITQSGVCWALTNSPTLTDSVTVAAATSGSFSSTLSNLNANTIYYYRAYGI